MDAAETLLREAAGGGRPDWPGLQQAFLRQLCVIARADDASPASTVHLSLDISTVDQMREFLIDAISAMSEPPICMQRLAEVLQRPREDAKFYRQLERIVASSRTRLLAAHPLRRRTSRGSDASSSSAYSISPKRRILKRPRRFV